MPNTPAKVALVLVALTGLGCRERQSTSEPAPLPTQNPVRIIRPAAPGSFVELVAKLEPSIVHLRATEQVSGGPAAIIPHASAAGVSDAIRALGTGFIVDTEGYILTNHHVLGNATEVIVVLANGDEHKATIVGRDPKLDLALLKIPPLPVLKPVRFGDSDGMRRGEWVLALGNPFGTEVTASAGIISSLGHLSHEAFVEPAELNYLGFIQTDARIDATNSGGPVVNTAGEVLGIATASQELGGTVGYAVPIGRAESILPQLKSGGVVTRSYVGVYVDRVSSSDAQRLGMPQAMGALVTDVVAGGPAALAGLRPDDVILTVDGRNVSHASLPWLISNAVVGSRLKLGVWRAKAKTELVLVTTEMR